MMTAPPPRDLPSRLTAAGRGTVLMTGSTMAASFVAQLWMARELGPAGLGAYAATALFVIMLATLASAGLPIALTERIARLEEGSHPTDDVVGTASEMTAVVAIAAAAVAFALWPFFAALAGLRVAAPTLLVSAAVAGSVAQSVAAGILIGRLHVLAATALVVLQPVAVIAALTLTLIGSRPDGSFLAAVGAVVPGIASLVVFARARAFSRAGASLVPDLARRSLAASSLLYPSYLAGWLDRFFIVALVSTSALGAFAGASALIEAVLRLARNVGTFSVPAYARLAAEGTRAERVLESQVRLLSAFFIVSGAVMVAAGPGFLAFLYGPGFAVAGTTLRLLAIALVPYGLLLSLAASTAGTDRVHRAARIMILVAPLHIVGAILGVRAFSIAGVALSDLVVWTLAALLFAAPWSRGALVPLWLVARMTGVAVPLFVLAWWLSLQPLPWAIPAAAAGVTALAVVSATLLTAAEGRVLRGLAGRPLRTLEGAAQSGAQGRM